MGIKAEVDVVAGVVAPATNFPVSEMTVFFVFFVILLSINSKLYSGSEKIGLRYKMKMMLHINVK